MPHRVLAMSPLGFYAILSALVVNSCLYLHYRTKMNASIIIGSILGGPDFIYKNERGLLDHSPCGCGSLKIQNPCPGLHFYYFPNYLSLRI